MVTDDAGPTRLGAKKVCVRGDEEEEEGRGSGGNGGGDDGGGGSALP